jgi:Spy/CpxP family protein refolding chaperone
MKRILGLAAGGVLICTGMSFAMSRWFISRVQPQAVVNIHDAAWLNRELGLSETQRREVAALEKDFRSKLNASCAEHCAARFALGDELIKPQPDPERARADVERMNQIQAGAERATLEHILRVRALLTEEQARRYSAIIRDQVCNMPMGTP